MTSTKVNSFNYLDTSSDGLRKLFMMGVDTIQEYIETSGRVTVDDISEIADGLVPVYNFDLLELAGEDLGLGHMPEDYDDLSFNSAYEIIMRSIYHELETALYQYADKELGDKAEL